VKGLSVCWREPDQGDEGVSRALRITLGQRLVAAGYELVHSRCDLHLDWGFHVHGPSYDKAFRSARLIIRTRDEVVEKLKFEFSATDAPANESDRLAIILVNAINASPKVARMLPRSR
jgi:hypothetical protein